MKAELHHAEKTGLVEIRFGDWTVRASGISTLDGHVDSARPPRCCLFELLCAGALATRPTALMSRE